MKITVAPASAQTSRAAILELLETPTQPHVTAVYRNLEKVPPEFKKYPNFKAVKGDVADRSTLDFFGSDALITMSPPKLDGSDYITFGKDIANNVADAVRTSGTIRRVVYVSSMGAQYSKGVGEVVNNHNYERILEKSAPEVVLVRNCFFMENWLPALETIKTEEPYFHSYVAPLEYKMPMVSVTDIGRTCAREAMEVWAPMAKSPLIFDLHGPSEFSVKDVKEAFEQVTGKMIEVKLVQKDNLKDFFGGFLPPTLVDDFVEMVLTFLPGGLLEEEMKEMVNAKRGRETLVDAFTRMWKASSEE